MLSNFKGATCKLIMLLKSILKIDIHIKIIDNEMKIGTRN